MYLLMGGENAQINSLTEDSALFREDFLKAPLGAPRIHIRGMPNVR
jgi:hypothetical protein